jgi:hypothetical protein
MAQQFDHQWDEFYDKPDLERLVGGPTLGVLFFMIVHSGKQYEWLAGTQGPTESNHTPLMVSFGMPTGPLAFAVDVVPFAHLTSALSLVEMSFDAIARQVVPSMSSNPAVRLVQKGGPPVPERF